MKILSWNINGIRGTHKANGFIHLFDNNQYDIICLQEIKSNIEDIPDEIKTIPGYTAHFFSATKKGYSGTAIYSKIPPRIITHGFPTTITKKYHLVDNYGDANKEGRVITAEFEKFFLVNVYTPNSKSDLSRLTFRCMQWDKAFLAHIQQLEKTKPVIFCGDLNVAHQEKDLARPKENTGKHGFTTEERAGIDAIIDAKFIDSFRYLHPTTINAYTYWDQISRARSRNIGWRIDYIFVSQKIAKKITASDIVSTVMGSDHCPVVLTINL